jgi:hypothetical protein
MIFEKRLTKNWAIHLELETDFSTWAFAIVPLGVHLYGPWKFKIISGLRVGPLGIGSELRHRIGLK